MRLATIVSALLCTLACWAPAAETRPLAFPDPAPAATATSDAEVAAAVAQVLAHPLSRRLLDLDAQLAEAIPAFEKAANVLVMVERKPLVHVMLTAWWQYVASRGGAPRPVLVFTRGTGADLQSGYALLDIPLFAPGGMSKLFPEDPKPGGESRMETSDYLRAMAEAGTGIETRVTETHGLEGGSTEAVEQLAIVQAGRVLRLSPAQARDLARPVVVGLRLASPVQRKVDFSVDRMPLPEAAANLAKLAGADLVIPSQGAGDATPLITVSVHAKTIEEILHQIGYVTRWVCDTGEWMNLPGIGVDQLFDPAPRPLLQVLAQTEQGPSANGALALLEALRGRLSSLPLRPTITFRPDPDAGK